MSNPSIKVSVLVMTYNHAKFIRKALDSALMQKTDFKFEIIISEDCSTDGTREIVLEYQHRFPKKIRLLLSEKNIHTNEVVSRGIHAAQGNYIALLDGDDYWLSSEKLQKQANFLDTNLECSMCFHNAQAFNEDSDPEKWNWTSPNQKEFSTLEDLWRGNFIATCSTMFRNNLFGKIPQWYDSFFPLTDWPLYILIAEHGKIGYINEVLGAYRLHAGGLYSPYTVKQKLKKTLDFYRRINRYLDYNYNKVINTAISIYFYEWTEEYYKRREFKNAMDCFKIYLSGKPVNGHISLKKALKMGVELAAFNSVNFLTGKKIIEQS
jgi:glycosyltransferase involved in cell wall biosynthesis